MSENQSDSAGQDDLAQARKRAQDCCDLILCLPREPHADVRERELQAAQFAAVSTHLWEAIVPAVEAVERVNRELTLAAIEVSPGGVNPVCGVPGANHHQVAVDLAREFIQRIVSAANDRLDAGFRNLSDFDVELITPNSLGVFCQVVRFLNPAEVEALRARVEQEYHVACRNRPTERPVGPSAIAARAFRTGGSGNQDVIESGLPHDVQARQDRLIDRFPLLGEGLSPVRFRTPADADWLPPNWESPDYPKGDMGSDNREAILQWLSYYIILYDEKLVSQLGGPWAPEDPEQRDRGGPVRDAYRLVAQLQNRGYRTPAPPTAPRREYVHCRRDLQASVAEFRRVREWVGEAAKVAGADGTPTKEPAERGQGEAGGEATGDKPDAPEPRAPGGSGLPPSAEVTMSATEAARYVGLSRRQMRRWIRAGKLDVTDVGGGQFRFLQHQLDTHKAARSSGLSS